MKKDEIFIDTPVVIVYISGALGDLLLSVPSLKAIRYFSKSKHLHVISGRVLYELYPYLFDSFTDINSSTVAKLFSNDLDKELKSHPIWQHADTFIVFYGSSSGLLDYLSYSKNLNIYKINSSYNQCKDMHYSCFLYYNTLKILDVDFPFTILLPEIKEPNIEIKDNFAVIHPGSGSKKKNCLPEKLLNECINQQNKEIWQWILIYGESDEQAKKNFMALWKNKIITLYCLNLKEVAWLLKNALYYIGNDSGISHLAGILGVKGTVFFGPTDPKIWAPLNDGIKIKYF